MTERQEADWSPTGPLAASLRKLWAEGHSTAEIGRRLGVSKNAVVAAAHRLDLPPRANPVAVSYQTDADLMPKAVDPAWVTEGWPHDVLATVLREYTAGTTIKRIAAKIGYAEYRLVEKLRKLRFHRRVAVYASPAPPPDRLAAGPDPLPAGHPIALEAIGMSYREFLRVR